MSLRTSNKYGKISITDDAVANVCSKVASECYGVVDLVSRRLSDNLNRIWGKTQTGKGIKIATVDNLMFIEVFVILKLGVNIEAIKESIKECITYTAESFTGMRVKHCGVNIVGIKV